MFEYKFYQIDAKGRISSPPSIHLLPDAQAAIRAAKSTIPGDVEIWQGDRLVANVPSQENSKAKKARGFPRAFRLSAFCARSLDA